VAADGLIVVAVLPGLGTQLNPSEAPLKNFPGTGTAVAGRQMLADARISPGVMKPFDVLVEHGGDAHFVAAKLRGASPRLTATSYTPCSAASRTCWRVSCRRWCIASPERSALTRSSIVVEAYRLTPRSAGRSLGRAGREHR
jgi:hypothetical protein